MNGHFDQRRNFAQSTTCTSASRVGRCPRSPAPNIELPWTQPGAFGKKKILPKRCAGPGISASCVNQPTVLAGGGLQLISEGRSAMDLRFWTDAETGLPHIYNHGVTEEEVREVLAGPGLNRRSG